MTIEEMKDCRFCNHALFIKIKEWEERIDLPADEKEVLDKITDLTSLYNYIETENIQQFIDDLELLYNSGMIKPFLRGLTFLYKSKDAIDSNQIERYQNSIRIKGALAAYELTLNYLKALEIYLEAAEQKWIVDDAQVRSQAHSKKYALQQVWKEHSKEISAILEKHNKDKTLKQFCASFETYLDFCRKWTDGITGLGHKLEMRAPRSAESRERSRQGAQKKS